jgi:hypothetical protein
MAYCLMGLFDVNMPLLYGEGTKAFTRLQEEIIRTSTDQSIFLGAGKADDLMSWQGQCVPHTLFVSWFNVRSYSFDMLSTLRAHPRNSIPFLTISATDSDPPI